MGWWCGLRPWLGSGTEGLIISQASRHLGWSAVTMPSCSCCCRHTLGLPALRSPFNSARRHAPLGTGRPAHAVQSISGLRSGGVRAVPAPHIASAHFLSQSGLECRDAALSFLLLPPHPWTTSTALSFRSWRRHAPLGTSRKAHAVLRAGGLRSGGGRASLASRGAEGPRGATSLHRCSTQTFSIRDECRGAPPCFCRKTAWI